MSLEVYREGGAEYRQPSVPNVVNAGKLWFDNEGGNHAIADGTAYGAFLYRVGIAGYSSGGTTTVNTNAIHKVVYFTEAVSSLATTLGTARSYPVGLKSFNAGYVYKGDPGTIQIDKLTFETESTSVITSNTYNAVLSHGGGFSSKTDGYALSQNGAYSNAIDRLYFSTEAASFIGAVLTTARASAGCESSSYGYATNGATSASTASNKVDKLNFTNDVVSALGATTTTALMDSGAFNSDVAGFIVGGRISSVAYTNIYKIDFANDSITPMSLTLPFGRSASSCNNSYTDGYLMGGNTSGPGYTASNTVSRLQFADNTISNLIATLPVTTGRQAGFENLNDSA